MLISEYRNILSLIKQRLQQFPSVGQLQHHLRAVHKITRSLRGQSQRKRKSSTNYSSHARSPSPGPSRMADSTDSGPEPSTRGKKFRPPRVSVADSKSSGMARNMCSRTNLWVVILKFLGFQRLLKARRNRSTSPAGNHHIKMLTHALTYG